jgi:hypothetical protein
MSGSRVVALLACLLVLAGFAFPSDGAAAATGFAACLICGPRGVADAILAAALFVPIGALLAVGWRGGRGRRGWARWVVPFVAALAGAVFFQALGVLAHDRQANAGAILFSGLGAAIGLGLVGTARFWARPSARAGDWLAVGATAVALLVIGGAGWLLHPDLPDPPYRVEFETERPGLMRYPGAILGGGVEPVEMRPGPSGRGEVARELLVRGAPIGVFVIAGAPPHGVAPVIGLYDIRDRTVVMLAIDSVDLVYRDFTRASGWRLDNPDVRVPGAFDGLAPGDTVRVVARRSADGLCYLSGDGWDCGHGIGAAGGWRVLRSLDAAPAVLLGALSGAWLALLVVPIGFWARWPVALALGGVVVWYALVRAPLDTVLVAPPPLELLGVAAGLALGFLARRATRR